MSVPYSAIVRFQYDPDPQNASDDLQLAVDETITVTEVIDDDWLFGSKQLPDGSTASGYFPRSFVAEAEESEEGTGTAVDEQESIDNHTEVPSSEKPLPTTESKKEENMELPKPTASLENTESGIVHEPEDFKNKLQSFNVSSTPIMPQEKRNEEAFVKKSFNGVEHRSSYIPPTFGTTNQPKREENKPIVGEVVRSESHVEEEVVPTMSVKERMMLLQKQQAEQEAMLAAAMKRKEEKKKKSKRTHENAAPVVGSEAVPAETEAPQASAGHETEATIGGNNSDEYLDAEKFDDNDDAAANIRATEDVRADEKEDEVESDEEDDENNEDEDDEDSNEDDEEDDDEDEEEVRKRELAQRMAKLSGGIGMMGMMGMMPSPLMNKPAKKTNKKKVKEDEAAEGEAAKPVPILPMMGAAPPIMGMPLPHQSPVEESHTEDAIVSANEDITSEEDTVPVAEKEEEDDRKEKEKEMEKEKGEEAEESSEDEPAYETNSTHPYRTQAAPLPPSPAAASVPPTAPTATVFSEHAPLPPPAPPVTQAPATSDIELNPFPEPPSVPSGLPPSMPQTSHLEERPPMPPPPPTRTTKEAPPPPPPQHAPGAVPNHPIQMTAPPPPMPGAVPSIPIPTATMTAPPPVPGAVPAIPTTHFQPPAFTPSAPPPVPGDFPVAPTHETASRKSSVMSKPPNFHAPPPPPPAPSSSAAEATVPAPPVINRQLTRTSLESTVSLPLPPASVSPTSNSQLWWTTGSLPPQLSAAESLFEVETTDIKKRNGDVVRYVIYYILDVHLACTTLELAYHALEPERILFYHESKEKTRLDPEQLMNEYAAFGAHSYNAALKLLGQNVGSTFIERVFAGIPGNVLPPVADKTFGAVVYRNNNGDSKFYEEIRPGDILVLVKATFESSSGIQKAGFDKPHVAVVTSFEADKDKIKVLEEAGGVVHQARYRLNKMKTGKLRVFRVVGRSFVGW